MKRRLWDIVTENIPGNDAEFLREGRPAKMQRGLGKTAFDEMILTKVGTWWKGAKELRKQWCAVPGTKACETAAAI